MHNLLVNEGAIWTLFVQTMLMTKNEAMQNTVASTHGHPTVQSYCGHVPSGLSKFCDYWWQIWDLDLVQVVVFLGLFTITASIAAIPFGLLQAQKKQAYLDAASL